MVEVKVEQKDKQTAEITFVDEDLAMVEMLKEILLESDEVDFVAALKEHPEVGHPKLMLKMKRGSPTAAVAKAAAKIAKMAAELQKKLE
jgi:DNA-directed RNA polymerase subunit L